MERLKVSVVLAIARNNGIGFQGRIPWNCPNDLKFFRKLTTGRACICGRKTFESLPKQMSTTSTHGRVFHVLSSQPRESDNPNVFYYTSWSGVLRGIKELRHRMTLPEPVVIGGKEIYEKVLSEDYFDATVYVSEIFEEPKCDTFLDRSLFTANGRLVVDRIIDENLWVQVYGKPNPM